MAIISGRGTITSLALRSLNSKMFSIISCSVSSIVPDLTPSEIIPKISSSEGRVNEKFVFSLKGIRKKLLKEEINLTRNLNIPESGTSNLADNFPIPSENLKPIAFGISKVHINTIVEITIRAIKNEIIPPYSCRKTDSDFTNFGYK